MNQGFLSPLTLTSTKYKQFKRIKKHIFPPTAEMYTSDCCLPGMFMHLLVKIMMQCTINHFLGLLN